MINAFEMLSGFKKVQILFPFVVDSISSKQGLGFKIEQKMNKIKFWIPKIADYVVINYK